MNGTGIGALYDQPGALVQAGKSWTFDVAWQKVAPSAEQSQPTKDRWTDRTGPRPGARGSCGRDAARGKACRVGEGPHEPMLGGDGEEPDQDGVQAPKHEISVGHERVHFWTRPGLFSATSLPDEVQFSEAAGVQQHKEDGASGDRCTESRGESPSSFPRGTRTWQSALLAPGGGVQREAHGEVPHRDGLLGLGNNS